MEGSLAKALLVFHSISSSWPRVSLRSLLHRSQDKARDRLTGDHQELMSAGETGGEGDTVGDSSVSKAGPGSCGDHSRIAVGSTLLVS